MELTGNLRLKLGHFQLDTGDFTLELKGVTVLFGRSGSGKSSFLRALSGLEPEAEGSLSFAKTVWLSEFTNLPAQKRHVGFVFQDAALFPHLTVRQNLLYGIKRLPAKIQALDFDELVAQVGITHLLERSVPHLSGGEKQRVAIARALLMRPQLLCMDEPLSALDWRAKSELLGLIETLSERYHLPILYITHSPEEVERLADTVVFMEAGKITRIDPIEEALNRADTPLYQEVVPRSVLSARVAQQLDDQGLTRLKVGKADLFVPQVKASIESALRVVISAQQVSLLSSVPEQTSMLNHIPVKIETMETHNEYSMILRCRVLDEPWPLLVMVTKRSAQQLQLEAGQSWIAALKSVAILN